MRLISFALTTPQFLNGSKTVTRRLGWANLRPGTHLMAVEKGQGIPKGGHVVRLGEIEVVSVRREFLFAIDDDPADCAREGFPAFTPVEFVAFFCKHNRCDVNTVVTRIEFRRMPA